MRSRFLFHANTPSTIWISSNNRIGWKIELTTIRERGGGGGWWCGWIEMFVVPVMEKWSELDYFSLAVGLGYRICDVYKLIERAWAAVCN